MKSFQSLIILLFVVTFSSGCGSLAAFKSYGGKDGDYHDNDKKYYHNTIGADYHRLSWSCPLYKGLFTSIYNLNPTLGGRGSGRRMVSSLISLPIDASFGTICFIPGLIFWADEALE